jgi:ABC-2 type transport system permease protein
MVFIFTGVLAQTLFQSTASGIISLVEDRVSDFSQEMFIAPVSRYTIIIGKIIGETLVSMVQGVVVLIFGLVIGVPMGLHELSVLFPVAIIACLFGGAFGLIVMSNMTSERTANQIFPFLLFPQFFLAGVFSPIKDLPIYLWVLSRIAPMTYIVDLARGVYYMGKPEYKDIVLHSPLVNFTVISVMFVVFILLGTYLFVKNERNR